jgi:putative ABC transport system permease protein
MRVPFAYVARNLWVRKLTTVLTAGGMALVVFVFAAVLMLDAGLKSTLVSTGSADNVVVIRQGSQTEVQSGVLRDQAALIETSPEVARGPDGQALVSKEIVVLNSLPKIDEPAKRSNVVVRGLSEMGKTLRPQVRVTQGRMFRAGSSEIVVGASVARQFAGVELGQQLTFAGRAWTVVGVFDAGRSAFDSEIWGDVEQMMQAFRRISYSSVIAKLSTPNSYDALKERLDADPRLKVEIKRERRFYEDQSSSLSNFITLLGMALSIIFSLGAMIGATITMYAAVATRTSEIGTLRALGFRRASILAAFLAESLLLALLGGLVGLVAASFLTAVHRLDDQLPVVFGTSVLVRPDAGHRRALAAVRPADGVRRRILAGDPRRPHENRRRAACRLGGTPSQVTPILQVRYADRLHLQRRSRST